MSQAYNIAQLKTFKEKYLGQRVTDPIGLWKGECVSLVKRWLQWNKWPMLRGNAIEWIRNGDGKVYKFYPNTPTFVPLVGDMAIFSVGQFGHIGIVENATLKSMNVLQQNDPVGSPVKTKTYNYVKPHCVGFLRKL